MSSPASAYYDPHSKCIKVEGGDRAAGRDGRVTLTGVVVHASPSEIPFFRDGRPLMGEIIEIVDPSADEGDAPLSQSPSSDLLDGIYRDSLQAADDAVQSRAERLMQGQRQLQSHHAQENQNLLHKFARDWEWFRGHNLKEERRLELQGIHLREALGLQSRQQGEQRELVRVFIRCLEEAKPQVGHSSTQTQERQLVLPETPGVVSLAAGYIHGSAAPMTPTRKPPLIPTRAESPAPPSLTDRISTDRQRADEIKTVMRDRSLSRDERQRRLAEIKERYGPAANEQKRSEIQAIMRDRSLGREEKQERMAEVQARYAAAAERDRNREASQDRIDQMKATVAAAKGARVTEDEGPSSASEGGRGEDAPRETAANHWNRTVVKVATSNIVTRDAANATAKEAADQFDEESPPDTAAPREAIASRWNRAAVKVTTSNIVTRDATNVVANEAADQSNEESHPNTAAPRDAATPREAAASRWNRAAIKVVTSNIVTRDVSVAAAREAADQSDAADTTTDEEPGDGPTSYERAAGRWNKAAVSDGDPNRDSHQTQSESSMGSDMVFDGPKHQDNSPSASDKSASDDDQKQPDDELEEEAAEPPKDPLEDLPTERTPIKKLIRQLNMNDAGLTVLKLDGRKKIKKGDWESLFESLEDNSTLTHLSMSRCEITDEMAVALVLALVENETLVALRLNSNRKLTDDTAKGFIKVLNQSNKTLKKLELTRTRVTKASARSLSKILEDRDDSNRLAKAQEEREKKIRALLAFSAGDKVAQELRESESMQGEEGNPMGGSDHAHSVDKSTRSEVASVRSGKSGRSGVSHGSPKKGGASSRASSRRRMGKRGTAAADGPGGSVVTRSGSRVRGGARAGAPPRAGARRAPARARHISVRASVTAQAMSMLGGDMATVGGDSAKLKEQRKMRGECEICGQKCFMKTMFKTTPLTIPNAVYEGRCLKCDPM